MKILVTGANGFIGSALCPYLNSIGHEVVPAVRRSNGLRNERIVHDKTSWKDALKGCESIIHLAARAHIMHDQELDPLRSFRLTNVDTTRDLANLAVEAGVRRFIFISTIKVNGEETLPGQSFKPNDLPAPQDAYAISKREAEQALIEISEKTGLEVVIIRPPLVYGSGVREILPP